MTVRILRTCAVFVLTAFLGGTLLRARQAQALDWSAADGARVATLENAGHSLEGEYVVLWYPSSLSRAEAEALLARLDPGVAALRRTVGLHAWQRVKSPRITYYLSDDTFVSHASGRGAVFVPMARIRDGRAPLLHEATHELLSAGPSTTPTGSASRVRRPLWPSEGLPTFIAESVAKETGIPEGIAIEIDTPMAPPRWAVLERRLLADNVPALREFFDKYFDERGYIQCFVRWGANDGPDDAFENFNRWPELHALGASDEVRQMYTKGHEGLIRQYTEAKTTEVPVARQGMYYKEFIVQSDWMHHGEALQLFNRMGLSAPRDQTHQDRARRFAGFYMAEDPEAANYDPRLRIIRSMQNGSRGPMLRPATSTDWVGDSFDVKAFDAEHGESSFEQFLAHYEEYTEVVGDHFLNLAATTLPTNAYLLTGDQKYRRWIVDYMDAWLDRMRRNGGIIPSHVDLEGRIGGRDGQWWRGAYGWGFSPVNPVTGSREHRNRIGWSLPGFFNALLVTGNQKYVDAWRDMARAVNSHARQRDGRTEYPTMHGADGWYGWRNAPWDVGAIDVWYWSQRAEDLPRANGTWAPPSGSGAYTTLGTAGWIEFLQGRRPDYPEQALQWDLSLIDKRLTAMRRDTTPPERRLADNMLDYNPAAAESLVQLMWGALMPGRNGGLLNARVRYFDPERERAGVPEDVAALVSELSDTSTTVTLVNLSSSQPRTVIVQGGAYGEHQLVRVAHGDRTTPVDAPTVTVRLAPGSGARLVLTMRRYAHTPTARHPWD